MARGFIYLNILGDGIHNLLDGMVIAASFSLGFSVGIVSTVAVVFHEIPQEIGDFGVLVYGGSTKARALILNFLSALTAVAGSLIAYTFSTNIGAFTPLLISFSAGGFIYLSASELVPELQKEERLSRSIIQFILFIAGLLLVRFLGILLPS